MCCTFRAGCVHGLGWALIALGLVGAAVAIAMDVLYASYGLAPAVMLNAPIWGGVFVIITGGLAVCSGKNPEGKGKMIAVLVMSIFAIMAAMCIWIIAVIGLTVDGPQCEYYRWGPGRWFSEYIYYGVSRDNWENLNCSPAYGLHAFQLVIGLLEVAFALAVSIMSCCGTCCAPSPELPMAVYKPEGQQVIIMQGGAGPVQPSPQPGQHYPGQQPYPVQQIPGQQQLYPGQQPPYPVQPSPGQQPPYPVQPSPGQQPPYQVQPSPGQQPPYPVQQQPYPVPTAPGQQPYPVQQLPYPQHGQIPSAPPPTYTDAVDEKN